MSGKKWDKVEKILLLLVILTINSGIVAGAEDWGGFDVEVGTGEVEWEEAGSGSGGEDTGGSEDTGETSGNVNDGGEGSTTGGEEASGWQEQQEAAPRDMGNEERNVQETQNEPEQQNFSESPSQTTEKEVSGSEVNSGTAVQRSGNSFDEGSMQRQEGKQIPEKKNRQETKQKAKRKSEKKSRRKQEQKKKAKSKSKVKRKITPHVTPKITPNSTPDAAGIKSTEPASGIEEKGNIKNSGFGQSKKEGHRVKFYHDRICGIHELPRIEIWADTGVQILSLRMNEKECPWHWEDQTLVLEQEPEKDSNCIQCSVLLNGSEIKEMPEWNFMNKS